jgi:intracellular sulfur oxidation DsrE/DsrF family protein
MTSVRRKLLLVLGLSLTLALVPASLQAQAAPSGKVHHILFALTSGDEADWHLTMGNIRNLLSGLAPDEVEIEVVAYGPGLTSVVKPSAANDEIQALMAKHVVFVACENSMRARKVTKADLIDNMGTVPSGVVEVVKKQEAGWTYVKAGR